MAIGAKIASTGARAAYVARQGSEVLAHEDDPVWHSTPGQELKPWLPPHVRSVVRIAGLFRSYATYAELSDIVRTSAKNGTELATPKLAGSPSHW